MRTQLIPAALAALALCAGQARAEDAQARGQDDSFWSRVTVELPAYTHHIPHDAFFNDQNWGAFVDYRLTRQWSLVGGDFKNSYSRNTAFAAVAWTPIQVDVSAVRVGLGAIAGVDLNGGYRGFNQYEPLLGALTLRLSAAHPEPGNLLNRFGLLTTVIPPAAKNGSTAINVAVTYRLQ